MATYHISSSPAGFRFNLVAGNGQVILRSETYTTKTACHGGVESVRVNSNSPQQFEMREAKSGESYFVLKATNGQIIGTSETYASKQSCEAGIESVMKNGPSAIVKEV